MTHGFPAPAAVLGDTVLRGAELRLSNRPLPLVASARLYVCGITPYDITHLGHAATFIWSDVAGSVLRMAGVQVITCRNVTDVDDVLTRAAGSRGRA
jgi:cysteinyl-tRNA synthetase